jgi:hypothetical protein
VKTALILVFSLLSTLSAFAEIGDLATSRGTWGGRGIDLELNRGGGTLNFDCAHGLLLQPVRVNRGGQFNIPGTFTPEHGGPTFPGEHLLTYNVRYRGFVSGSRMYVRFSYFHDGQWTRLNYGPLFRGSPGQVHKCL